MHASSASLAREPAGRHRVTALVVLLVAAVWTFWFLGGRFRAVASAPVFDRVSGAVLPPLQAAATFAVESKGPAIQVFDESGGAAVGAAELWQVPTGARQLDPAHCRLLARSKADGSLEPPAAPQLDPSQGPDRSDWVLRAPGYRAVALPRLDPGTSLRVGLRRGAELRLRCTGPGNSPLAGARVAVARSSAPTVDDVCCGRPPGGDNRSALYTAHTDNDGVAVLSGLTPGTYALQVLHDHYALVDAHAHAQVQVPGPVLDVRMVDLLGCVLTPPEGDFVEASAIKVAPGELLSDVMSMTAAQRVQDALRRAHPGSFVHVVPGEVGIDQRRVRGKALLRTLGFRVFDVELRPVRTLVPLALPVAGEPQPRADLRVTTGRTPPPQVGLLLRHDDDGITCHVPLPLDRPLRLPVGSYALDAKSAVIRALLPKAKFTLAADRPVDLPLDPGDWRVVQLHVLTASGDPVGPCSVQVLRQQRRLHGFIAREGADIALDVPAGPVAIEVAATGFVATRVELTVPDDTAADTVTVRLDYGD